MERKNMFEQLEESFEKENCIECGEELTGKEIFEGSKMCDSCYKLYLEKEDWVTRKVYIDNE